MSHEEFSELLHREEAKRNRMWDPLTRWRMIQHLIDWADAQRQAPRCSREGCLAAQCKALNSLMVRQELKAPRKVGIEKLVGLY
jgi:hypothetical protein